MLHVADGLMNGAGLDMTLRYILATVPCTE